MRSQAVRPVLISRPDDNGSRLPTHTLELEPGALTVGGPLAVETDELVVFAIDLVPGHPPVGGIARVTGTDERGNVTLGIERIAPHDRELLVRYILRIELPDPTQVTPRSGREWPRVPAFRPAVVHSSAGESVLSRTVDVSAAGILLTGPPELRVGQTIWIAVDLEEGVDPVEAWGTVVRQAPGGLRGIKLEHITEEHRERLLGYGVRERRFQRTQSGHVRTQSGAYDEKELSRRARQLLRT